MYLFIYFPFHLPFIFAFVREEGGGQITVVSLAVICVPRCECTDAWCWSMEPFKKIYCKVSDFKFKSAVKRFLMVILL